MSFKTQMVNDMANCILNTNEFAETVIYTPKGGTAKEIKAVITRRPPEPDDSVSGRVLQDQVEVSIVNDATYGIATVSLGGDTVVFPKYAGGANVTWLVTAVSAQDEGAWRLIVTR